MIIPGDALDLIYFDFTTHMGISSKPRALLSALDLLAFKQLRYPNPVSFSISENVLKFEDLFLRHIVLRIL